MVSEYQTPCADGKRPVVVNKYTGQETYAEVVDSVRSINAAPDAQCPFRKRSRFAPGDTFACVKPNCLQRFRAV